MKKFMNQTLYTLLSCCVASSAMATASDSQLVVKPSRKLPTPAEQAARAARTKEYQARLDNDPDFVPSYEDMPEFAQYRRKPRKNRQSSTLKTPLLSETDDKVDAGSATDSSASASRVALQDTGSSKASSEGPPTGYAELKDGDQLVTIDLTERSTNQGMQPFQIEKDAPTPGCFSAFKRACLNAWKRLTGRN